MAEIMLVRWPEDGDDGLRLAESMGGHLWCEPAPDHGARFVISLPAAAAV